MEDKNNSFNWFAFLSDIGVITQQANNYLNDLGKQISNFLDKTTDFGMEIYKHLQDFQISFAKIITIFDNYDWWMLPFYDIPLSQTFEVIEKIIEMPYKKGKQHIDEFILNYYRGNDCKPLKIIINNWDEKYFERRKKIFEDALSAHENGIFTLSIPALTCQIEGILWEWSWNNSSQDDNIDKAKNYFGHKMGYNNKFINKIKRKVEQYSENNNFDSEFSPAQIERQYNLHRLKRFFDRPKENFNEIEPKKYSELYLNRNLIAHGLYLNYEDKEAEINSLKLFLLLDLLYCIISEFKGERNIE